MLTAKDIMTTNVITVQKDTSVNELAEILWKNKISGAPVLDDDGNVVSVVTESDLIDQTKKVHIPTMISILDSVIFLESSKKTEKEIKKMAGNTVQDICAMELSIRIRGYRPGRDCHHHVRKKSAHPAGYEG